MKLRRLIIHTSWRPSVFRRDRRTWRRALEDRWHGGRHGKWSKTLLLACSAPRREICRSRRYAFLRGSNGSSGLRIMEIRWYKRGHRVGKGHRAWGKQLRCQQYVATSMVRSISRPTTASQVLNCGIPMARVPVRYCQGHTPMQSGLWSQQSCEPGRFCHFLLLTMVSMEMNSGRVMALLQAQTCCLQSMPAQRALSQKPDCC